MQPPLTDSICVRQTETGGKTVVSVLVQPGPSRLYGLIGKLAYAGGAFVREGTRTVEASLDSVMEMIRQGDPCSWEKRACGRRDLTFSEATAELETDSAGTLFAEAVRPDTGRHKAETPPSNLELLLSDQNPYGVILNTYDSAGRLTKSEKIPGSVLIQRRLVYTRLAEINWPLIDKETDDFVRRETFPWPPQALSAAVTLMLMHRDYASPLASAVCIHTDTIRFLTPGGIPADLALGQKLLESSDYCRNAGLSRLFRALLRIGQNAEGLAGILHSYAGRTQQPRFRHVGRSLLIELPVVLADRTDREADIIRFLAESPVGRSRSEIESLLGLSRPTVRKLLEKLAHEGKVLAQGKARAVRWYAPLAEDHTQPTAS